MTPSLLVIGGGGHAAVVIDAARCAGWTISGVLDDDPACEGALDALAVVRLGSIDDGSSVLDALPEGTVIHAAAGDPALRRAWVRQFEDVRLATIVHPSATVARSAILHDGVFVAPGAVIGPRAWIATGVIVNSGAVVEHDCELGDYAHVAPRSVLAGGVRVGAATLIGVGATVQPGAAIGAGATIGAGAVVLDDVPDGETWYGVPARLRTGGA